MARERLELFTMRLSLTELTVLRRIATDSDRSVGAVIRSAIREVYVEELRDIEDVNIDVQDDAPPIESIKAIIDSVPVDKWTRKPLAAVKKWLVENGQVQP